MMILYVILPDPQYTLGIVFQQFRFLAFALVAVQVSFYGGGGANLAQNLKFEKMVGSNCTKVCSLLVFLLWGDA